MADKDFKVKSGLSMGTPLPASMGGTGQTSLANAFNAILPLQAGNAGKVLTTDGNGSTSWVSLPAGYLKGNTSSRPGSPSLGDIYSNTETGYIEVYTSEGWSQLGVIPSSPTIETATDVGTNVSYGSGSVDVGFTPGSGGGLVSSFTAVSNPGSISGTSSSSPVRVTGLSLGTAYTFTVTATNAYGNSLASSSSPSATTTSVPQAPTIGSPSVSNEQSYTGSANVSVPFTTNATGGKSITSYTITSSSGNTQSGSSSPILISDTVGTSRTYTVKAINSNGSSVNSSSSSSVTPISVPQAPTIGTATSLGTGTTASIAFTAGAAGGSSITSYTVTSSPGSVTATGTSSPITISGLTQNTQYTFTVTATNSSGTSSSSSASNSITTPIITMSDTFDRSNGTLGTSSSGNAPWSVLKNDFTVNSNRAYSSSTSDSIAVVPMATSTITNAQADMYNDEGGMGIAFWVTDANSWWSVYPSYTSVTTSTTTSTCSSNSTYPYFEYQNTPADACNRVCVDIGVYLYCSGGTWADYYTRATCGTTAAQRNPTIAYCNGIGEGWYYTCTGGNCNAGRSGSSTTYSTTYSSSINIKNQSGIQHTNTYSAAISPVKSIAISTSGDAITYSAYNAINKGGSVIASSTYTPSSPTKGTKVGVFKTASSYVQGNYIDNIAITVA